MGEEQPLERLLTPEGKAEVDLSFLLKRETVCSEGQDDGTDTRCGVCTCVCDL